MKTKEIEDLVGILEKIMECGFVSKERFETEKRVANELFYFVLIKGLLDEYVAFNKEYKSDDPHKDCVNWLLEHSD